MANYRVYGLASTQDSAQVLVAVHRPNEPRPDLRLTIEGGDTIELANHWRSSDTGDGALLWQKPIVEGLAPGTTREVRLLDRDDTLLANAHVTSLPTSGHGLHLIAGSCFDLDSDRKYVLRNAYADLRRRTTDLVPLHLWLGDQVYVDAPWDEATRARDARRVIFDRYLRTWALDDEDTAFADAMRQTSNWYLADDHEFWNGYPHPSWGTLFWHTFRRVVRQIWRARPTSGTKPHPASQAEWGHAAGDAFCVFGSTLEFTEFGENVTPDGLQTIDVGDLVVVLVDTRWRRTIRKTGAAAGFMLDEDLDRLVSLLDTEERPVCIAVSRPVLGYLPHRGVSRGKAEYATEDYSRQYAILLRALARRAAARRPTITIAGDVHQHAVRTGFDDGVLEVVSSSMSILQFFEGGFLKQVRDLWGSVRNVRRRGLRGVWHRIVGVGREGAREAWSGAKHLGRIGEERLRGLETPVLDDASAAFPRFGDGGDEDWTAANGTKHFAVDKDRSGVAGIEFDLGESGHPQVTIRSITDEGEQANVANSLTVRTRTFRWDGAWQPVP